MAVHQRHQKEVILKENSQEQEGHDGPVTLTWAT